MKVNELEQRVNQIKLTFIFFLIISAFFTGVIAMMLTTAALLVSYMLATMVAKGYENFKIKDEYKKLKEKVTCQEESKVLKEDIKENTEQVKNFFKKISEYDYWSKIPKKEHLKPEVKEETKSNVKRSECKEKKKLEKDIKSIEENLY